MSKELEAWRNRPMTVKVFDLCEPCGQLLEDVHERYNYFSRTKTVCCADCMERMIREASGVVVC
jgi:hypothetical protein